MMNPHLTVRGWSILAFAIFFFVFGFWFGITDLVRIGLVMGFLVVTATIAVAITPRVVRKAIVIRTIDTEPLQVGSEGRVDVQLMGRQWRRLELGEQASSQLTVGGSIRPGVWEEQDRVRLVYTIYARARGLWAVGPVVATRIDPLGIARKRHQVGPISYVRVWPRIIHLTDSNQASMGFDQMTQGSATSSPDDVGLRDYREGDDLRRIHWPSSARRGNLVVRTDEQSGRPSVTVVVSRPSDPNSMEWVLSVAASAAVMAYESGYQVRFLGIGDGSYHKKTDSELIHLLDPTVLATGAHSPGEAGALFSSTLGTAGDASDETIVVMGAVPSPPPTAWMLFGPRAKVFINNQADAEAIRRAGCHVVLVRDNDDLRSAWGQLADR